MHDWLVGGGAERVVLELHRMFPDAPIYTSYCTDEWRQKLDGKVVTGFLQRWPFGALRKYVGVLRIWWFTHLDFSGYDLVISSTGNGEAKGIKVPAGTAHICYCHSPTHYYWRHYEQYLHQPGFGIFDPLARVGLKLLVGPLRKWDLKASKRPDIFIANSTHIQKDIKRFYGRDAVVIHPPIDTARFSTPAKVSGKRKKKEAGTPTAVKPTKRSGFVTMGRLAPAKRVDIAVQACTALGLPLTVIGDGADFARLQKLAGPTITFLSRATGTRVSDQDMPQQLASAEAFIFTSFDDFGIAPLEAMAAGTPVIAYKAGGALEYVKPAETGAFFLEQTPDSLMAALSAFEPGTYDHAAVQRSAQQFSPEVFKQKMASLIASIV